MRCSGGSRASAREITATRWAKPPEILYEVNGGSIDWMYGEQTSKSKIYSFSTEIGGSGFWPDPSEKDGLIAENLHSILYLTQVAGPWATVADLAVSGGNGNGRIDPGETVDLLTTIRNESAIAILPGATIRLRCDDPYIRLVHASAAIGSLDPWRELHEQRRSVPRGGGGKLSRREGRSPSRSSWKRPADSTGRRRTF